jgi:hypothetical protein
MAYFDPFVPAKREEVPDYARAAFLQAQADNDKFEAEQRQHENRNAAVGSMYRGVADSMPEGKTPISEALRLGKAGLGKLKGMGAGGVSSPQPGPNGGISPGPSPVSSALPGTSRAKGSPVAAALREQPPMRSSTPPPQATAPKSTPMPQARPTETGGAWTPPSQPTPPPVSNALGNSPQASVAPASSAGGSSAAAGGIVGALNTAGNIAQQPTTQGKVKAGVGGVGMTGLSTAGPALAAAGPVGWAGLAGLAAMSLYGMLG